MKAAMFGAQRRHSDHDLAALVRQIEDGAAQVQLEGEHPTQIRNVFVEVFREMESDDRHDGACHMLAALGHVLLSESSVQARLCVGEILNARDDQGGMSSLSHSWNQVDGVLLDVSIARPLVPVPFETRPTLGGLFIPSRDPTPIVYGVPIALDHMAASVLAMSLGEYVEGARSMSGLDMWWWYERSCRRLGIKARAEKLARKYRDVRWHHVVTEEGRATVTRLGVTGVSRQY